MKISEFLPSLSLTITFLLLFGLSFFLNYLSALYSDINLFKIDLAKRRKDKRRNRKLVFILKNGNLLFALVSILQVFLNIFMSDMFMISLGEPFLREVNKTNYRWGVLVGLSLLIALVTEIFVRYLANQKSSRKMIFNNFFIDVTYSLIRIPYYFLRPIVKPRKKIFVNSEKDIIRFINNLTTDNIIEKSEAKLVQSAFNFDELRASEVTTPWEKVIYFKHDMSYPEIEEIHSQQFFTRYPVLNKKKEIIGVFSMKVFYWGKIKKKEQRWQNFIDKRIVYFSSNDKLDKVLIKLQTSSCHLGIIQGQKEPSGIITLQDVLSALIGKMSDERDLSLLPHRLN